MPRAMLFTGPGEPLRSVPQSTAPPPGSEIRVRILCCTLCRSDLTTYTGRRIEPTPTVLGHEVVGAIEEFGPTAIRQDAAGRTSNVGDRIIWAVVASCGECFYCRNELEPKCERGLKYGHHATDANCPDGGGLADTITLSANARWFRIPDRLSTPVASLANCAGATAAAILDAAGVLKDRSVLVFGAGMLGLFACAMARSADAATVVAVDPDPACRERASMFGATHALDPDDGEFHFQLHETLGIRGADIALELAGRSETAERCLASVRIGGTIVLAGTVGPTPPIALDPQKFVRRWLTLRGVHNYRPENLQSALEFLEHSEFPFDSLVAATFPLERAEEAFASALAHPGLRVAVVPTESSK